MVGGNRSGQERAFAIELWTNAALALAKLGVGWLAGSRALIADGWHSVSDVLTSGGTWWAHRFGRTPPDEDHHYGHGNAEALAGVLVGVIILLGGAGVLWSTWRSDVRLEPGATGWVALGVALVSVVANVGLAMMSLRVGRRTGSHGLRALARDDGSDALAGLLVVFGILGAQLGLDWAEPLAAVVVAVLILVMGLRSIREGLDVLMDRVPDPRLRERLRETAGAVEGVRGVQSVRVHPLGSTYRVDMEISVDAGLTVVGGHEIAHAVERAVKASRRDVEAVHVHVNPSDRPRGYGPTLPASDGGEG